MDEIKLKLQEILFKCEDPNNPLEVLIKIVEDYGHMRGVTYDENNYQQILNIEMYDEDMFNYLYKHRFDFLCVELNVSFITPQHMKIN